MQSLTANNHNNYILFSVAGWCRDFAQVSTPRGTRFESQQEYFFQGGGGYILCFHILLETWIVGNFCILFVFFFIYVSMKFMYANRTSPDGPKRASTHLTIVLVICNHGIQPRRGGDGRLSRVLDFSIVSAVPRKYQDLPHILCKCHRFTPVKPNCRVGSFIGCQHQNSEIIVVEIRLMNDVIMHV